ncbi:hypothetical protein ACFVW9_15215 [Streptomyces sp. NPDC058217]|uniref:hypothetical protein n=1 Tax=Streptomyces sp. NPDC058217 TaxID=3346384 RepID=UPI0036EFE085
MELLIGALLGAIGVGISVLLVTVLRRRSTRGGDGSRLVSQGSIYRADLLAAVLANHRVRPSADPAKAFADLLGTLAVDDRERVLSVLAPSELQVVLRLAREGEELASFSDTDARLAGWSKAYATVFDEPSAPVPDLLDVTENVETGRAVAHLAQGFDELFRALGPPPEGLAELEPTSSGDGGTAR